MNHLINPTQKEVRIQALLYLIGGILLFILNNDLLMIATRILGVILIAIGGTLLYMYFIKRASIDAGPLFTGLPAALIGLLMLISPESLIAILPVLTGIVMIINSIMQLQKAFLLKDYGFSNWTITAGIAAIALLFGVLFLFRPLQSVAFILQIIGIALIVEGCLLFGFDCTLRKAKKEYEKDMHDYL